MARSNTGRFANLPLQDKLDQFTVPGDLFEVVDEAAHKIRCTACAHRCLLKDGRRGVCKVRFNEDGVLRVPSGYVAALQVDPIEKKPFNHILPGGQALSFGMLGCNMHCEFCQNWDISQTGHDVRAGRDAMPISAEELVHLGRQHNAQIVASTYNEPLITTEWAVSIFKQAQAAGMKTVYISNGSGTPEVIDYLAPNLDGYKIDLKSMRDKPYRQLGAVLQNVLDTITDVYKRGLWLEVVTLVVPGFNDSTEELWDTARFLAGLSPDIPWHVTAYRPAYKMDDPPRTSMDTLRRAAEIGSEAGLNFVYAGNLPGQMGEWADTRCPSCQTTLIQRRGFTVTQNRLAATGGTCPDCGTLVPGRWS